MQAEAPKKQPKDIRTDGTYSDIPKRGLKETTCRTYRYQVVPEGHIANWCNASGQVVAQKVRKANKEFQVLGDAKAMGLWGQQMFPPGGKAITITEGELDALSVAQAFDCRWPVVSLPHGAQQASKAISGALEYLSSFEKVVLCFDMDEHGRKATEECVGLLPPGKAYVMRLPHKDANETLLTDGPAAITKAFWAAAPWRPDGIVAGNEITKDSLKQTMAHGYTTGYTKLDQSLGGLRKRELILLTAGTGIGKSTFARELAYTLHQRHGLTVGNVYLEESKEKTAQGYVAIHNNVPLGDLRKNPSLLTEDQWDNSIEEVLGERMYFYDHFGSMASDSLLGKLRYLSVGLGCDFIILDHISIVISGTESSSEGERRDIDVLMTKLRMLIESTGVGIIAICHLSKPEGKAHEEGGRVTLSQLRGSQSLKQIPDAIVALERNQQSPDDMNLSQLRLLKNREFGVLGMADVLAYDPKTGRLVTTDTQPFEEVD